MAITDDDGDEDEASPLQVGHNIYILAYKLSEHKRELKEAIEHASKEDAVRHYADNTAQIEVGILVCLVGYSEYTDLVTAQIEVGILVYRVGYSEYTDLVTAQIEVGILVYRVGYSEYTDLVTAQIEVGI